MFECKSYLYVCMARIRPRLSRVGESQSGPEDGDNHRDESVKLHHTHLCDPTHEAIVSIRSFMCTCQPLHSGIRSESQSQSISMSHLFEFTNHTIRDDWNALGHQTIHHASKNVCFVLYRKIDKVGVHQNLIRRAQLCVILEEHRR